jgi:hypothetical protein
METNRGSWQWLAIGAILMVFSTKAYPPPEKNKYKM